MIKAVPQRHVRFGSYSAFDPLLADGTHGFTDAHNLILQSSAAGRDSQIHGRTQSNFKTSTPFLRHWSLLAQLDCRLFLVSFFCDQKFLFNAVGYLNQSEFS